MSIVKFFSIVKKCVGGSRREDLTRAKFRIILDIGERALNGEGFTKEELKAEYRKEGIHISNKEIDALFEELIYLD